MSPNLDDSWEIVETGKPPHRHRLPLPYTPGLGLGAIIMCKTCQTAYRLTDDPRDGRSWMRVNRVEGGWK